MQNPKQSNFFHFIKLIYSIWYTTTVEKVDRIIDVATLTGAVIVALGAHYTGAVGNDEAMMQEFLSSARLAGEKVWQLPADDDYPMDEVLEDLAKEARQALARLQGEEREFDDEVETVMSRAVKKASQRIWGKRPVVETTVLRV